MSKIADAWEYAEERASVMEYCEGFSRSEAELMAGIQAVEYLTGNYSSTRE